MRHIILTLLLILIAATAHANTAQLAWDASPSEGVAGYIIYYGPDPDNWTYIKPVGNVTTAEVAQLPPGEWFFTVTAYSADAESSPSNIVSATYEGFPVPEPVAHEPVNIPVSPGTTLTINVIIGE